MALCEQLITKDFLVAMEKDELSVIADVVGMYNLVILLCFLFLVIFPCVMFQPV